jgi:hypothetical protein
LPPEVLDSRITVSSVADGFVANWDYFELDGITTRQPNDFDRYEYKWEYGFPYDTPIWTSQVGDWTSSGQSGRAELTYDQNDVVFGTAGLKKPLVRIKIRTVNTSGLSSTGQTSTDTAKNPEPSAPTDLLASTSTDAISLTWNAPIGATDNDLKYYNVYVYKASVLEKVTKFPHIQSSSSPMPQSAELTFTDDVARVIKIKSVDKFDQESASFSSQISIAATAPTIVSDLKTRISAWSRADTTGLVTITTIEDHGLQVYSPQNINTVSAAFNGVRTATLASSPVFSVTDRVKITGLSTASLNEDVVVLSVVSNQFTYKTSDTTSPAITGTSIGQVLAKDWVMISDSSNGTTDCNTLDAIPVTIQSVTSNKIFTCIPDVSKITSATGTTGYVWHTGNIVKINKGSINVGNLESNKLVAIYPTSFSLQSGFDGQRIAITSEGIDGYKVAGVQTVRIGNDGTFYLKSADTGNRIELDGDNGLRIIEADNHTAVQIDSEGVSGYDTSVIDSTGNPTYKTFDLKRDDGSLALASASIRTGQLRKLPVASRSLDGANKQITFTTAKNHGIVAGDYVRVSNLWDEQVSAKDITVANGVIYSNLLSTPSLIYPQATQVKIDSTNPQYAGTWGVYDHGHFKMQLNNYQRSNLSTAASTITSFSLVYINTVGVTSVSEPSSSIRTLVTSSPHGFKLGQAVRLSAVSSSPSASITSGTISSPGPYTLTTNLPLTSFAAASPTNPQQIVVNTLTSSLATTGGINRTAGSTVITFTTAAAHNLLTGSYVQIANTAGAAADTPSGTFVPVVKTGENTFTCSPNSGTTALNTGGGYVYTNQRITYTGKTTVSPYQFTGCTGGTGTVASLSVAKQVVNDDVLVKTVDSSSQITFVSSRASGFYDSNYIASCTISNIASDVISSASHGLLDGNTFRLPNTTTTSISSIASSSVISSATYSSGTGLITYTASAAHTFFTGQTISISGGTNTAYNLNNVVINSATPGGTTFTVAISTNPGTWSGTGAASTFINNVDHEVLQTNNQYSFRYIRRDTGTQAVSTGYVKANYWLSDFAEAHPFDPSDSISIYGDYTDQSTETAYPTSIFYDSSTETSALTLSQETAFTGTITGMFIPAAKATNQKFNYTYATRINNSTASSSYLLSTASWASNVITYTTTTAHQFSAGQIVSISGAANTAYNLSNVTIASATAGTTTFTVSSTTNPGTWTGTAGAVGLTQPGRRVRYGGYVSPGIFAISAASWSSGTNLITYTTTISNNFSAGNVVSITGSLSTGYNLDNVSIVSTSGTNTFTVAMATDPGFWVGGGVASVADYKKIMILCNTDSSAKHTMDSKVAATLSFSVSNGTFRVLSVGDKTILVDAPTLPTGSASSPVLTDAIIQKVSAGIVLEESGGDSYVAMPSGSIDKFESPGAVAGVKSSGRQKIKISSVTRPSGSLTATFTTQNNHNFSTGDYVEIRNCGGTGTNSGADTIAYTPVIITRIDDISFSCQPNLQTGGSITPVAVSINSTAEKVIPIESIYIDNDVLYNSGQKYYTLTATSKTENGYNSLAQRVKCLAPHGLSNDDSVKISNADAYFNFEYPKIKIINPYEFDVLSDGPRRITSSVLSVANNGSNYLRINFGSGSAYTVNVGSSTIFPNYTKSKLSTGNEVWLASTSSAWSDPAATVMAVGAGYIDLKTTYANGTTYTAQTGAVTAVSLYRRDGVVGSGSANGQVYKLQNQRPQVYVSSPTTNYEKSLSSIVLEPGTSKKYSSVTQTGADIKVGTSSVGTAGSSSNIASVSSSSSASTSRIILNAGEVVFTANYSKAASISWNTTNWEPRDNYGVFLTQEMDGWWCLNGMLWRKTLISTNISNVFTICTIDSEFARPENNVLLPAIAGFTTAAGTGPQLISLEVQPSGRVVGWFPKILAETTTTNKLIGSYAWGTTESNDWISLSGIRWKATTSV